MQSIGCGLLLKSPETLRRAPAKDAKGDLNHSLRITLAWQHAFPGEDLTRELSAFNAECFFSMRIVSVSPLR